MVFAIPFLVLAAAVQPELPAETFEMEVDGVSILGLQGTRTSRRARTPISNCCGLGWEIQEGG